MTEIAKKCPECGAVTAELRWVPVADFTPTEEKEETPLVYLVFGYSGDDVIRREYTAEEVEKYDLIAGPYPSELAAWKDMLLLNTFINAGNWAGFARLLLMINNVLPNE